MRCPHCKGKNADNAVFCKHCDKWILESVYKGPRIARFRFQHFRIPRWVKPAAVCLITLLVVLWGIFLFQGQAPHFETTGPVLDVPGTTTVSNTMTQPTTEPPISYPPQSTDGPEIKPIRDGYTLCENSILYFPYGDTLQFLQGDQILKTDTDARVKYTLQTSLDGNVGVCLTGERKLYLIYGDTVTQIATQVRSFALSVSGNGIAYKTITGELYLYHVASGEAKLVANQSDYPPGDYVISPDGMRVLFTATIYNKEDPTKSRALVQYRDGVHSVMGYYHSGTPISVSDDGNVVYLFSGAAIFSADTSGTLTNLGSMRILPSSEKFALPGGKMYLNSDHTQLLYYQENGTYLSVEGQAGRHLAPAILEPIAPQSALAFATDYAYTYPHASLLEKPYSQCSDIALELGIMEDTTFTTWYVKNNFFSYSFASGMHNLVLDSKGEYLYGIGPGNRLQQISMKEANQANDSFGGVIINRNVDKFALSPDGTKLAYVKQDRVYFGNIATAEWEAHAETFFNAQQTISNLYITAENHFFFDWSRRIYSWNWGQMQYTVRYIYTANGMLYYRGDAAFYMIQQDGMSLKLCDIVG